MTTLHAQSRQSSDKVSALRAAGKIPAVLYGGGLKESIHITLEKEAFKKAWAAAGGSSTITVVAPDGEHDCIIHDFQYDPISHQVIHADLLVLEKGKPVEVTVELEFDGISPAVKSGLGVLEKMLHEIEIEALPKDLPKSISIDISTLVQAGDHIYVRDVKLPPGVTAKTHGDEVIATITEAVEETEESAGPIDFSQIEVEKKGKKEDETESAE